MNKNNKKIDDELEELKYSILYDLCKYSLIIFIIIAIILICF